MIIISDKYIFWQSQKLNNKFQYNNNNKTAQEKLPQTNRQGKEHIELKTKSNHLIFWNLFIGTKISGDNDRGINNKTKIQESI